jgi:putative ABC transport system permease protein
MERKFFPNQDCLGKRLILDWDGKPRFEIVGIVGDVLSNLDGPPEPTIYFPLNTGRFGYGSLVVRSTAEVTSLALPIQKEIAAMDATLPVSDVLTMEQIMGKSMAGAKFNAALVLFFAVLALLLASMGLYGLLSYLVTQRSSEIGLRVALGAQRLEIVQLMLASGLRPMATGLLIGLAAGAVCAQWIRGLLFGVRPFDVSIFATVGLVVTAVSAMACAVPAWRASRVDPLVALRYE